MAGHDNIEPLLGFGAQLTSVADDHARMVEVAVSALLAQLEGPAEVQQVVLPAEVVYRRFL